MADPLEIRCDAPPFTVVKACEQVGFHAPLDVRWCRMRRFLAGRNLPSNRQFGPAVLAACPAGVACTCGEPLPELRKYAVTFVFDRVADYLLGQCRRCRTIFWEEG